MAVGVDAMCGIVGLFAKRASVERALGALLAGMLASLGDRGPDSAGFAVYRKGAPGRVKITLRAEAFDFDTLPHAVSAAIGQAVDVVVHATHAVLSAPEATEAQIRAWLALHQPEIAVVGSGARMELFKEIGAPAAVAERFGLARMTGTHGIGHTRMATESAVTTDGAHPYSTGPDQCLVHNGSLSNHNAVRRTLARRGQHFATENDTEVAAGYLTAAMLDGRTLGEALQASLADLDGFFTFVVGTETGFGVLRDAIACKPAVMAETDDLVAFGSEYQALADLPGIGSARVWEPAPATVYFWDRRH